MRVRWNMVVIYGIKIYSPKEYNSKENPPTNLIQYSSNIKAKFMETSDSMACECKLFTHEFLGFRPIDDMEIKLNINKSYMDFPKSSNS